MAIFYTTDNLPVFQSPVITIGTFDGVHLGHYAILEKVRQHANHIGGESILLTFEPHPRKLIFPDQPIKILTPLDKKIELVGNAGIRHVVVVPFTKDFACLSAREYVTDFLVSLFHPAAIVIGYDHHFGNDRKGNIDLLKELQGDYGFEVVEIPAQLIEDATVSSTKIRNAITAGHVGEASSMLGRYYTLAGRVVKGAQIGRTIGYPTANIVPHDAEQIIPGNGVYAVNVLHEGSAYPAMLNIGYRPTVSSEKVLHIEAHLFDFSGNLYDADIEISFVQRLRDEQKFGSLDELKAQLGKDEDAARSILTV
jgi:riboflavin kinase/FMN adenylyltransferase